ncbi:GNAT family N-acetyltransferase [Rhizobium sullae]|uniref:N-acetyltransferase n=1 Tax=Rhizobium sullae TaxID=50338 RepID=A0A2N0D0P9_RHISU|nr:GNAT family N-acetyltransferase [Rhizobium sullae]PKA39685.1 N-acetyltransferase [Rhizobium sullae]UWU16113.1 GNAT family N-acetyltransferase [Rhizobium sullae]
MASFAALRPAERRDAAELAILVDIGSHGFASWLWFAEVAGGSADTPLERGRMKMSRDGAWGNWQSAVIADAYGEIAGTAVGYTLGGEIGAVAADRPALEPVIALQKQAAGNWFIGTLAVYRHLRGIGIGKRLLVDQIEKADGRAVSLITASDNEAALALYEKNGFSQAARAEAVPLFENSRKHEWVLLTRLAG